MDAIGIILVVIGVLIILATTAFRGSGGAAGDVSRLGQRVPGGWITGAILVLIGLIIIAIPWGPPPGAGPPDDVPAGDVPPGE